MEKEIQFLKKAMRRQRLFNFFLSISILTILLFGFKKEQNSVIRTKGLIIEDENGKPRIIMGHPIQNLASRKRHDTIYGIIFLSENGIDRINISELRPNPQVNGKVIKRISKIKSNAGIGINDLEGNERTGWGFKEGVGVNMAFDYKNGMEEALALGVIDEMKASYLSQNAPSKGKEKLILYTSDELSWVKLVNPTKSNLLRIQALDSLPVKIVSINEVNGKSEEKELIMKFGK